MIRQILARPDDSPTLPQMDYEQCAHPTLWHDGFDPTRKRGKAQRFRCASCGRQFVTGADRLHDKRVRIGRDLIRGLSIRAVARRTNTSREAVRRVRGILEAAGHASDWHVGGRPNLRNCGSTGTLLTMAKVSVFLEDDTHRDLKQMAFDRRISLTKLIEHICNLYRKDLTRRKKAA